MRTNKACQPPLFCNATIALAIELSGAGVSSEIIERAIGDGITHAVRCAKRYGMHKTCR
jgi:hypothetical protein